MIYPDDYTDFDTRLTMLTAKADDLERARRKEYARRIRAANDRYPPLRRGLIWQSPLLIAAATVALIVGITLIWRAMVG